VRVIRQRQRGVSVARNVGIAHARSDFVAFLDDDDRMLPNRLRLQFDVMKDESIGLCHTQFRFIDQNGAYTGPGMSKDSQYRDFLECGSYICLSSTMVRKSLIEEVGGFNSVLSFGEDLDFIYRIARESSVRFLPDVLTDYRRHGENVWLDTVSGGQEIKLILTQHLWTAEARGEDEYVEAIHLGLATVMTGRAKAAMFRSNEARSRGDSLGALIALGQSFVLSPMVTTRIVRRAARRDGIAHRMLRGSRPSPGGDDRGASSA
jgi:glycosyltransferase involved in cell wall biosynthesis